MGLSKWRDNFEKLVLAVSVTTTTGCTGVTGATFASALSSNASLSTGVSAGDLSTVASGDTSGGNLQLLATSNAFLHGSDAIQLGIEEIDLHVKGGDFVSVAKNPASLDLSKVQNGVTASLAQVSVDAGTYDGLRIVYSSVSRTLDRGDSVTITFDEATSAPPDDRDHRQGPPPPPPNGEGPPRNERFLRFHSDLVVTTDAVTHVLLAYGEEDRGRFDVLPHARAMSLEESGALKGIVSKVTNPADDSSSMATPVANAAVFVLQHGRAVGTALTDENGAYNVIGLVAGSYDVVALAQDEHPARAQNIAVTAGSAASQDISFSSTGTVANAPAN